MSNQINLPRILQIGAKASQEVGNILRVLNYNNPIIITDNIMVKLGYTKKIQENILGKLLLKIFLQFLKKMV